VNSIEKLDSFRNLPDGWNYGSGRAILDHVHELAVSFLEYFEAESVETDVFPGTEGSVCITTYGHHDIELEIEIDLSITITVTNQSLSINEARLLLRKICGHE